MPTGGRAAEPKVAEAQGRKARAPATVFVHLPHKQCPKSTRTATDFQFSTVGSSSRRLPQVCVCVKVCCRTNPSDQMSYIDVSAAAVADLNS